MNKKADQESKKGRSAGRPATHDPSCHRQSKPKAACQSSRRGRECAAAIDGLFLDQKSILKGANGVEPCMIATAMGYT